VVGKKCNSQILVNLPTADVPSILAYSTPNQPKWLTKGGDLRKAQVNVPCSVWPFQHVTALLASLSFLRFVLLDIYVFPVRFCGNHATCAFSNQHQS
jgi:hypothetical protein